MSLNFDVENGKSGNMNNNTEDESTRRWKQLSEKLAIMKIASDEELNHMTAEAGRLSEDTTSLERKLNDAKKRAINDVSKARADGRRAGMEEALNEASCLLDSDLRTKAAERLNDHCDKTMKAKAARLDRRIKSLRRAIQKNPSDKLSQKLVDATTQREDMDTQVAELACRQRIRRATSRARWSIIVVSLSALFLIASMIGIDATRTASRYERLILDTAEEGLESGGEMSRSVWNGILTVYNEEFGTDYKVGR